MREAQMGKATGMLATRSWLLSCRVTGLTRTAIAKVHTIRVVRGASGPGPTAAAPVIRWFWQYAGHEAEILMRGPRRTMC